MLWFHVELWWWKSPKDSNQSVLTLCNASILEVVSIRLKRRPRFEMCRRLAFLELSSKAHVYVCTYLYVKAIYTKWCSYIKYLQSTCLGSTQSKLRFSFSQVPSKPLVDFFEMKPAKTKIQNICIYGIDVGTCHISFPTIVEGVEHLHQLPQKDIFLGGSTAKMFAAEAFWLPQNKNILKKHPQKSIPSGKDRWRNSQVLVKIMAPKSKSPPKIGSCCCAIYFYYGETSIPQKWPMFKAGT